jgi:hypothetical protein
MIASAMAGEPEALRTFFDTSALVVPRLEAKVVVPRNTRLLSCRCER